MTTLLSRLPGRPGSIASALTIASLVALAGCGGSSGSGTASQATATPLADSSQMATSPSTTPTETVAPTDPTTTQPSKNLPQHTTSTDPERNAGKPDASDHPINQLAPPSESDRLTVKSPSGTDPKWRVAARLQDKSTVCLVVTSLGVAAPAPDCQSGTQLALTYFSDDADGQASANVDQIQRSARNPPSDILVSGMAAGDVTKVVIDYLHHTYSVKLSTSEISLPVDRKYAQTVTGESAAKLKSLPNPLKLRVFGLSIPQVNGNPPTTAVPKTKRPVSGVMTLELQ